MCNSAYTDFKIPKIHTLKNTLRQLYYRLDVCWATNGIAINIIMTQRVQKNSFICIAVLSYHIEIPEIFHGNLVNASTIKVWSDPNLAWGLVVYIIFMLGLDWDNSQTVFMKVWTFCNWHLFHYQPKLYFISCLINFLFDLKCVFLEIILLVSVKH
jgi:hypothetical protein